MRGVRGHWSKLILCGLVGALVAGCGEGQQAEDVHEEEEWPARVETIWTDQHEWFVEHPLLAQGETAEFAAHLTTLTDFRAVLTGTLEVTLRDASGAVRERATADAVARPGIFLPQIEPGWTGNGRLTLTYRSPSGEVDEVGWDVRVAAGADDLGPGTAELEGIGFLKEQQWRIPFATVAVTNSEVQDTIKLPAAIERDERYAAAVVAPGPGIYRAPQGGLPGYGTTVQSGQALGTLLPRPGTGEDWSAVQSELVLARNRVAMAEHDRDRAERLVAAGAVPARRQVEAQNEYENAVAELELVNSRAEVLRGLGHESGASAALPLLAPRSGVINRVEVTDGEPVDATQPLFHVVNLDRLIARVEVPEPTLVRLLDASAAGDPIAARVRPAVTPSEGSGPAWIETGRLLDLGSEIDRRTRTAALRYEVAGAGDRLRPGMSAEALVAVGGVHEALVIPANAVIDLAGVAVVYVQLGGETFEERVVRTGGLHGERIEVLSGLAPGDRVVTTGAYQVRLAALSPDAAPAHSH